MDNWESVKPRSLAIVTDAFGSIKPVRPMPMPNTVSFDPRDVASSDRTARISPRHPFLNHSLSPSDRENQHKGRDIIVVDSAKSSSSFLMMVCASFKDWK